MFEHPSGRLFDHFEKSAAGVFFAYSEEILFSGRLIERYYVYSEDSVRQIAVREDDLNAKKQELETIVESTSKEEAKLRANRDACAEKIDARTMSAYEHIRQSSNNHLAVVSVFNGDSCGGCFNTIAPQRLIDIASNRKMIICEYCGRILVNPDFE